VTAALLPTFEKIQRHEQALAWRVYVGRRWYLIVDFEDGDPDCWHPEQFDGYDGD